MSTTPWQIVQWLLDAGTSVYETDARANTALILAARNGCTETCKVLKRNVGDNLRSVRNRQRQSAYDLAVSGKHTLVKRVLLPSDSDKVSAGILVISRGTNVTDAVVTMVPVLTILTMGPMSPTRL